MFEFNLNNKDKYNYIHFIGIGGVSMSGLAEILLDKGFKVSGSDNKLSKTTIHLQNLGADIYIGHNKKNIINPDLVVYTDAISTDNEELLEAKKVSTIVDRATFLGAIMQNYKKSIAVSGTHGKTTTTSMIASITNHSDLINPTILLGGNLTEIGGNIKLASDDYIITEACEYKGNVLKYFPTTAIILNIDEDHLDFFKNIDHIVDTFKGYIGNIKENGNLILNIDDEHNQTLITHVRDDIKVHTIGINCDAKYKATDLEFSPHETRFNLLYEGIKYPFKLKVVGKHNVYNALASIAASHVHGMSFEDISKYLAMYSGVQRRLELKGIINDVTVLDDYAHHPTEIQSTLEAIKKSFNLGGKTYCIFQPHTFTRTKILLDSFSNSFKDVDNVIITDIFAAREINDGKIHSKDLVNAVNKISQNAIYLSTFDEVESFLLENTKKDDLIVTMGAGDVYLIGENFLKLSENLNTNVSLA